MPIKDAQALTHQGERYDDDEIPVSPEVIPRDRWKRPLIAPRAGGERIARTRSSGFGKHFEDTEGLNKWGQGRVAIGVGLSRSLQLEASALAQSDPDERETKSALHKLREAAYELGGGNDGWRKGKALHRLTDIIDQGDDPGDQGDVNVILDRYRELMTGYEVVATEVFGANDRWLTAGTFDFLLRLQGYLVAPDGTTYEPGSLIMGDKKTSGTSRYFGAKFAVQLTTYATGTPIDKTTGEWSSWDAVGGRPDQRYGLILHFPSDPRKVDECGWHWVDLRDGERQCDIAAQIRAENKVKSITPCVRQPSAQSPDDVKRANAAAKIVAAQSVAALKMVKRSYLDVWTDELQAAGQARIAAIEGREPAGVAV
jgi:hypothetical protein